MNLIESEFTTMMENSSELMENIMKDQIITIQLIDTRTEVRVKSLKELRVELIKIFNKEKYKL